MCRKKSRKTRPMSSSRNGTWEGLALGQRTLGELKKKNGTQSLLRPFHAPLRSVNLVFDPKSARTRLGTRQVYRVVLTFESVDEIQKCNHSNESY